MRSPSIASMTSSSACPVHPGEGVIRIEGDVADAVPEADPEHVAALEERLAGPDQRPALRRADTVAQRVAAQRGTDRRVRDRLQRWRTPPRGRDARDPRGTAPRARTRAPRSAPGSAARRQREEPESGLAVPARPGESARPGCRAVGPALNPGSIREMGECHEIGPDARSGPMAEGVGFEPTVTCATMVFETIRFGRSRTPPGRVRTAVRRLVPAASAAARRRTRGAAPRTRRRARRDARRPRG